MDRYWRAFPVPEAVLVEELYRQRGDLVAEQAARRGYGWLLENRLAWRNIGSSSPSVSTRTPGPTSNSGTHLRY